MEQRDSTQIIVWSETAYKRGICYHCGTRVRGKDNMPLDNTLYDDDEGFIICPKCGHVVGKVKMVEISRDELMDMYWENRGVWKGDL